MKYNLSKKLRELFVDSKRYQSFKCPEKFMRYFLAASDPRIQELDVTLNMFDIQDENIPAPKKGEVNVLACYENCAYHKHYKHHQKYGDYGDPNIQIYIYNHIDEPVFTNKYIAIPFIWLHINHYEKIGIELAPTNPLPFNKKQHAILTTTNIHNRLLKQKAFSCVSRCGKAKMIDQFRNKVGSLNTETSPEFYNFINTFKFTILVENSPAPGYITEKPFIPFISKSIPIYWGNNPSKYFNENAYLDIGKLSEGELIDKIKELSEDEEKYYAFLEQDKIKPHQDFVEIIVNSIKKFM